METVNNSTSIDWQDFDSAYDNFIDDSRQFQDVSEIIRKSVDVIAQVKNIALTLYLTVEDNEENLLGETLYNPFISYPNMNLVALQDIIREVDIERLILDSIHNKHIIYNELPDHAGQFASCILVPVYSKYYFHGLYILLMEQDAACEHEQIIKKVNRISAFTSLHLDSYYHYRTVVNLEEMLEQRVAYRTLELQKLKNEYESIIDCVHSGIVLIHPLTHTIEYSNPAASEILECLYEPLKGKSADIFFSDLDADIAASRYLSLLYYNREKTVSTVIGNTVPIIQSAATILFEKTTYLLLSFYDITERKLIEQQLERNNEELEYNVSKRTEELQEIIARYSQEITLRERTESELEEHDKLFSTIYDVINVGLCVLDHNNNIVRVNNALCQMFGENKESLIDKEFSVILPTDNNNLSAISAAIISNLPITTEITLTNHKYHNTIVARLSTEFVDNVHGEMFKVLVLVDVTELHKAEQNILQALEKERQLSDIKTNFVAMVSHEFRTPLTTVLSYSQLLRNYRHHWSEEQQDRYFYNIETGVKQLTGLLEDVLLIGETEHRHHILQPQNTNIDQLCRKAIEDTEIGCSPNHHRIQYHYLCRESAVTIDPKLLARVITNLLTNALKYSAEESSVLLIIECDEDEMVVSVSDNGIGIPADYMHKLYEPFSRADNTGAIAGTGLGMAIIKKSVDLLNGEITVNSVVGQGTKIRITIPIN